MPRKRFEAIVEYPGDPKIVASVATTPSMMVLSLGDGRQEHFTYPSDGRFHITLEDGTRDKAFFAPGPPYDNLDYHRLAHVAVPIDGSELVRQAGSRSALSMTIPPPTERERILEVGVIGRLVTPAILSSLTANGAWHSTWDQKPGCDLVDILRYISSGWACLPGSPPSGS